MAENILEKIIKNKKKKIDSFKKSISIENLKIKIDENKSFINFKEKIENNESKDKISIIAEIKKASPSAGIIIENYDPVNIADVYNNNKATCLSVLTEEDFFLGNLLHISKIKQKINLPILCKDFFIDKFQVYLARSYGADAILIILAGVSDEVANILYEEAKKLDITGYIENLNNPNHVKAIIQGNLDSLNQLIILAKIGPPLALVKKINKEKIILKKNFTKFSIK